MRTAKGIILLIVLIAPVAVTFSWLQLEKAHIRKAVKRIILNQIDKSDLTLLTFSVAQSQTAITWEHDDEFEWQGNMYDVVSKESRGDSLYFWCFVDEAETKINQKIATLINGIWQENQNKKEQEKRLENFFKSLFIAKVETYVNAVLPCKGLAQHALINDLLNFGGRPPTPPPQVFHLLEV